MVLAGEDRQRRRRDGVVVVRGVAVRLSRGVFGSSPNPAGVDVEAINELPGVSATSATNAWAIDSFRRRVSAALPLALVERPVVSEAMRAYYSRRAIEYDDWWLGTGLFAPRERPGWHEEVAELIAALQSLAPKRTLDVACGTGFLTRHLPGDITALDQRC